MAIALFTDFGCEGIYTGQMEAVINLIAPKARIIHLLNNAPKSNPLLSSYLLQALSRYLPEGTIFLAVVDPGVGSDRRAIVLKADDRFFVGPANGLFHGVAKQAKNKQFYEIIWKPDKCSVTFHGRDIFAPVAASLYQQQTAELLRPVDAPDLSYHPDDLHQVIYLDHYGNAMTGINYHDGLNGLKLIIKGRQIEQAGTFSHVKAGELFWYKNSLDLVEIAANQSSARNLLNIQLADTVTFEQS